jgi:ATP-dependent DNA ligase
LQAATDHKESAGLLYFAFDLLFIDGENLTTLPLIARKHRLKALLPRVPKKIYYVDHVIGNGQAFYDATCKREAEGIVSKRVDAPYKPGDRGIWRKAKCINEDEFVVVGFANPEPPAISWRAAARLLHASQRTDLCRPCRNRHGMRPSSSASTES